MAAVEVRHTKETGDNANGRADEGDRDKRRRVQIQTNEPSEQAPSSSQLASHLSLMQSILPRISGCANSVKTRAEGFQLAA
jgi:hypothetical protein